MPVKFENTTDENKEVAEVKSENVGVQEAKQEKPLGEPQIFAAAELKKLLDVEMDKVRAQHTREIGLLRDIVMATNPNFRQPELPYDPDDQLPEPVVFFMYSMPGYIDCDRKFGRLEKMPAPVRFEYFTTYRDGTNTRDNKLVHISRYVTYSKVMATAMRNHTQYGSGFYENTNDISNYDYDLHVNKQMAGDQLNAMSQIQIINLTKRYISEGERLTIIEDFNRMRANLIPILAKQIGKQRAAAKTYMQPNPEMLAVLSDSDRRHSMVQ